MKSDTMKESASSIIDSSGKTFIDSEKHSSIETKIFHIETIFSMQSNDINSTVNSPKPKGISKMATALLQLFWLLQLFLLFLEKDLENQKKKALKKIHLKVPSQVPKRWLSLKMKNILEMNPI